MVGMALLSPPTFGVFSNRAVLDSRRLVRQTTSLCIGQRCLILTCSFPWKRKILGNARWRYRLRHVVASSGDDSGNGSPSSSNDGDDLSSDSIKEEGQLLEKLSQVEAKQEEIVSAIVREKDFVESELEAVQTLYEQKLQESLAEKSALELKLARVRQEAFEFAIQVEKMAELALKQTTEFVLEDAQHRVSAAETSAAEMVLQFEEQVRIATENAIASVVDHSKEAIQKALDASEKAGGQAAKALAAYNEVTDPVDEVSSLQSENIRLEVAITDLESKLLLSKNELEKLKLELEGAHAQANAAEIRAQNIEKALLEFQELNKRTSLEKEDEIKSMVEKMRIEVEDKNRRTVDAFKTELESIKAVVNAAKETTVSRDNAFISRCEALKRSLKASDFAVKTWKQRAESAESLLFKDKSETQDGDSLYLINGGRIDLLTDDESQKWKLLSDGPRKEIPQWLVTRIASIRPRFPPRKYDLPENFEPSLRLLELPKVDEVWSIAQEKTRDGDVLIDHLIEKEILEKKKKALERIIDKTASRWKKTPEEMRTEPGTGTGREIVFQAFNWESWRRQWYLELAQKAADLSQTGITALWFPPPTESVAPQGYMPSDLYNLNSAYGSVDELKGCIEQMHTHNLLALGDVVLNHRCAHKQSPNGVWNIFGGKLAWGPEAIVCDDPHFQGRGNPSSGDFFHAAPNVDHSQEFVRRDIKEWLNWLKTEIGFDGWRLDFVRGFSGTYVKEYIESSHPAFAIGEYWDSLAYENGNLCYNQDAHRQRLVNWINATGGTSSAFDVTTKGILHSALHNEYWRLIDPQGKPTGVMGWWPSRAVTFLENHDTGSTQGHWPFPRDKLGQGYAYILTHPGTPAIFYDHFYDFGMHETISELVDARRRAGIHCRSSVKIYHANKEGYVAKVGETLVMKIGHFHWNPSKENQLDGSWQMFLDKGGDYQIWLRV